MWLEDVVGLKEAEDHMQTNDYNTQQTDTVEWRLTIA